MAVCLCSAATVGVHAADERVLCPDANTRATPPATGPRIRDLLDELDRLRAESLIPAYGIAIVTCAAPAFADARGSLAGLDADSPFRIGSITKTFTALAMLRLAEQQHIDLNAPLTALARNARPDTSLFDNPWERTDPITPAMLLEHTAGLAELSAREWAYQDARPISLREGLALDPSSRRSLWRPGTQHVYSNAAPGLIAWLIEQRQRSTFETFVRNAVLRPLHMRNAGFLPTDRNAARLVAGYKADGTTPIPYWHQHIRAYAALHASPRDMSKLLATLLAQGEPLLTRESFERMLTPRTSLAARRGLKVGYGFGIYGSVRNGFLFYGHGGDADGYLSRFGVLPDAGRGYFVVINTDNPPALARFRSAIERWLTADLTPPIPHSPGAAPNIDLARYAGVYQRAASRFAAAERASADAAAGTPARRQQRNLGRELRVSLYAVDEHVQGLQLRGAVDAILLPTGAPGQFSPSPDAIATSIFAEEHGELYLQGDLGNFIRTTASAHAP